MYSPPPTLVRVHRETVPLDQVHLKIERLCRCDHVVPLRLRITDFHHPLDIVHRNNPIPRCSRPRCVHEQFDGPIDRLLRADDFEFDGVRQMINSNQHELAIEVKGATCTALSVKQHGTWIAQSVVDV